MKKILLVGLLFCTAFSFGQTTSINYNGNGNNNFGGAVGKGTLNIKETRDSVTFTLTKGPGTFDSVLVFYVDAQAGGISSTSGLYQLSPDKYSNAAAGKNTVTGNEARLDFPSSFQPDGAIAFDKDGGRVFYFGNYIGINAIVQGSSFNVNPTGTNSSPTYSFSAGKSDLGLTPGSTPIRFTFMGTYIGPGASRSNEGFGDPFTGYLRTERSFNPYTIKSFLTFASSVLPVKLTDFKATRDGDNVTINWNVAEETDIEQYDVQRSTDAATYTTIATVKARNSSLANSYSLKDLSPKAGTNYYRLSITERGKTEISKVVSVNFYNGKSSFAASYTGNSLNVMLAGISAGAYKISIINNNGQIVQVVNLQHDGVDQTKQLTLKTGLSRGIYRVALQSEKASLTSSILVSN